MLSNDFTIVLKSKTELQKFVKLWKREEKKECTDGHDDACKQQKPE